ncbi:MAG: hypothetical protein AABZ02_14115 [Bacteroidota bacterium]
MVQRHFTRFIALGVLIAVGSCGSQAQSSDQSAFLILRSQVTSIAENIAARIRPGLVDSTYIRVGVEARTNQMMVENVFLDVFGKAGLKSSLARADMATGSLVQVHVIDQMVSYAATASGKFQRSVQTVLEARFRAAARDDMMYLGSFQRALTDTVQQPEDLRKYGIAGKSPTGDTNSFFEKVAGPILMIAGAFLIVYLFFTVRN